MFVCSDLGETTCFTAIWIPFGHDSAFGLDPSIPRTEGSVNNLISHILFIHGFNYSVSSIFGESTGCWIEICFKPRVPSPHEEGSFNRYQNGYLRP